MKVEKATSKNNIIKEIIAALIPIFLIVIIELVFKLGFISFEVLLLGEINSLIFSILIGYLIYGILIGITKKLSTSTIIFFIIGIILLVINQFKIIYTGEPIYFSDINFISNINNISKLVKDGVLIFIKYNLLIYIITICIGALIIIWTKINDIEFSNLKSRCIITGISIILLIVLFAPNRYTKKLFLNVFLNNDEYKDYQSYTTNLSYYWSKSLLGGMYGILLNNRFDEPEGYNEEELNSILEEVNIEENNKSIGTPNIIVLFSESFWDIDKQEDIKFNKDVAENIKLLSEEGKMVETTTCSYGGMSENVAFELLTGGSLNYFTKGYIPIMSLYKRNNSEQIPSIVKELKNNGYESEVIFGKDYYNSEKSMKKIGFNYYSELEEKEEVLKGDSISDEYIVDVIIEKLKDKKEGQKYFLMAETIQNHMPYSIEKYTEYDIEIKESNFSDDVNNTILSYAQGVYDADKQMRRLYEYIKQYEEPTILIFLGDHLPYLYTKDGSNAIDKLKYFNTEDNIENIYRKYNTQALILSNYDVDLNNMPNYLSNNLLLTYIVNNMDIKLSNYYKWLYSTIDALPVSNSFISMDKNRIKYITQELSENAQKIYKLREYMQYKFFIKAIE